MQHLQQKTILVIVVGFLCLLGAIGYMLTHGAAPADAQPSEFMEIRIQIDAEGNVLTRKVKIKGANQEQALQQVTQPNDRPPANAKTFQVHAWKQNPTCVYINQGGVWYKICY